MTKVAAYKRAPGTRLEERRVDDLIPYANNARTHSDTQVSQLAASIREYGFTSPILIDKDDGIIAGHGRVAAAKEAGLDRVPVIVLRHLTEKQRRAYVIADNKLALNAEWNMTLLAGEVRALLGDDYDVRLTGFEGDELDELLSRGIEAGEVDAEPQIDHAEELRVKWGVESGQVWQLGEHRLACGDSTNPSIYMRLMGDDQASIIWTDPPYGVNYGDKLKEGNPQGYKVRTIQNDNLQGKELEDIIRAVFVNCCTHAKDGAAIYSCCPAGNQLPVAIAAFSGSGFEYRWQLVWVKDSLVLSRADYHFRHENILYGWKVGGAHYFTPERNHDSIFEIPRPKRSEEHPTMKPVALIVAMLENSSLGTQIVLEPFSGSGSTLIACEQLGRRCRAIEIAPGYVAVTLQRWADATGKTPTLLA